MKISNKDYEVEMDYHEVMNFVLDNVFRMGVLTAIKLFGINSHSTWRNHEKSLMFQDKPEPQYFQEREYKKEERERIIGLIEEYFKGLLAIGNPQATKEGIINLINIHQAVDDAFDENDLDKDDYSISDY